jgi:signal transduction histidine kinase
MYLVRSIFAASPRKWSPTWRRLPLRTNAPLQRKGPTGRSWSREIATRSSQAVRNLVENAITHTAPGSEIVIEVDPKGAVRVADRGPGVAVDERERIFDRFWRGKGSAGHGSGLGLAIVTEIMKAHHGGVELDDNLGGGTVFTLVFPGPHRTVGRVMGRQLISPQR